jgi:hypothetical protein
VRSLTLNPLGDYHHDFITLFRLAALQRLVQTFKNPFQDPGVRIKLFRPLLLVGFSLIEVVIYIFCVMGGEAFWPVLYTWVVFLPLLVALFGLGRLTHILLHWYLKIFSYIFFLRCFTFNRCLKQHGILEHSSVFSF